jgi:hypothetical protein
MTILKSIRKYRNSRTVHNRELTCPNGSFRKFAESYVRTLAALARIPPEVEHDGNTLRIIYPDRETIYTLGESTAQSQQMDRIVQHVYLIEVGRIRTMEIRDGGRLGASDPASR